MTVLFPTRLAVTFSCAVLALESQEIGMTPPLPSPWALILTGPSHRLTVIHPLLKPRSVPEIRRHHDTNNELLQISRPLPGYETAWVISAPHAKCGLRKPCIMSWSLPRPTPVRGSSVHGTWTGSAGSWQFGTRQMDPPE